MFKKIVLSLAGLLLLISPTASSADLLSDLQAQIQALLAQVATLQAQQQGMSPPLPPPGDDYPTPPTGGSCPNLTVTMQRGSRDATTGGQVSELQIWLANRYGLNDDDVVTGYFGATTERYVKQFQSEQGLPAYGIVGSLTRARIAQLCRGPVPPPRQYSVTITEPNSAAYVNYGQQLMVTWLSRGDFPKGSAACVTLRQEDTGKLFAWPPQGGSCVSVAGAEPQRSVSGLVIRNAGYDLAPGAYRAVVRVSGPSDGGKDGPLLAEDASDMYFKIVEAPSTSVNIQVNGSDGPLAVRDNQALEVAWKSVGMSTCFISGAIRPAPGSAPVPLNNLPASGNQRFYAYVDASPYYNHKVHITCNRADQSGSVSDEVILQAQSTATAPITVTAPNGGEQWEIGKLNTITWAPYGYNPDTNPANQVSVFLVGEGGDKIGKIMDTGKASLHTYLNIDNFQTWAKPGRYYVEVINTVTGARDRSDAPFTILPRAIDLKINGSDGPVNATDNQAVTVSWQVGAPYQIMEGGCTLSGVRTTPGGGLGTINLGTGSGSGTYYAYAPTPGAYTSVLITCIDGAKGLTHTDSTGIFSLGGTPSVASLRIVAPNGGEAIQLGQPYMIRWLAQGLKNVSLALYMNDTFAQWIHQDLAPDVVAAGQKAWTPSFPGASQLQMALDAGKIYKIYATGQKMDGTGYIDDKSDMPFRFVSENSSAPSCTVSTNKPSYSLGESIVVSWASTNSSYMAFDPQSSSALNLPGDKLATQGSHPASASSTGSHTIVMRVVATDGRVATCAVSVSVGASTAAGAIHATGTSLSSVASTLYPFTNNAKLAQFTLTARNENVRLNSWVFTVRNVGSDATVATNLSLATANIGGKEYPVHTVSSGLYSTYSVSLGAGQDFAKDVPTTVTLYGNVGASTGGTVDLWWSANDMKFKGVTSGSDIVPTSSVTNRGDNFYWSGWFSVPAAADPYQSGANAAPVSKESQLASALAALTALLGRLVTSL